MDIDEASGRKQVRRHTHREGPGTGYCATLEMQLEDSTAHLYDSYIACTLRVVLKLLYMHTWKGLRCCSGSYQHKMSWVNVRASIHIRLSLKYCIRQWVLWVPGLWSSVLCYVLLLGWAFSLYHNIILSGLIVATPPPFLKHTYHAPSAPPPQNPKQKHSMYVSFTHLWSWYTCYQELNEPP